MSKCISPATVLPKKYSFNRQLDDWCTTLSYISLHVTYAQGYNTWQSFGLTVSFTLSLTSMITRIMNTAEIRAMHNNILVFFIITTQMGLPV